jgi:hypothetical protein
VKLDGTAGYLRPRDVPRNGPEQLWCPSAPACYFYPRFPLRSVVFVIGVTCCVALAQGCARAGAGARTGHDQPVPASEPRAELALKLDLSRTSSCEEDFDLALYAHSGVDFITWTRAESGCSGRSVKIRYLPQRIERAALLAEVERLASKVQVEP